MATVREFLMANTLRGLVMHHNSLKYEAMEHVEIPSGIPVFCHYADVLVVVGREWLDKIAFHYGRTCYVNAT